MAVKFDMVNDLVLDNGLGLGLTIPGDWCSEDDVVGINISAKNGNPKIDLEKMEVVVVVAL